MANCIYCGGRAGLLKRSHIACRQHGETGSPEIVFLLPKLAARCKSAASVSRGYQGIGRVYFLRRGLIR